MRKGSAGLSLIELLITIAVLSVLASLVIPLTQMTAKRVKEIELRRNLRIVRTAIDDFKKNYDKAVDEKKTLASLNKSGYPETVQQLVDGYDFGGLFSYKKKFLRRIPADPFNQPIAGEEPKWALRSYKDDADTKIWGGEDLYDIHSLSSDTAIDGTKYNEW
jgi:general secretion pathway protein G